MDRLTRQDMFKFQESSKDMKTSIHCDRQSKVLFNTLQDTTGMFENKVMLDFVGFCPHCNQAVSKEFSCNLRRVFLTRSASADTISQACMYGSTKYMPHHMQYGSLDRSTSNVPPSQRVREKRELDFCHGSDFKFLLPHDQKCQHDSLLQPIPRRDTHAECKSFKGGITECHSQIKSSQSNYSEKSLLPSSAKIKQSYAESWKNKSDNDKDASIIPRSVSTSASTKNPYHRMCPIDLSNLPGSNRFHQQHDGSNIQPSKSSQTIKPQKLEYHGMATPSRDFCHKRFSEDPTMNVNNRAKVPRISPAAFFPYRSTGKLHITGSEKVEVAYSSEEALIEELLHDEEITDHESIGYDYQEKIPSKEHIDNCSEEELIAKGTDRTFSARHGRFVTNDCSSLTTRLGDTEVQECFDVYTKEAITILESMGDNEREKIDADGNKERSTSPDDIVEEILDSLDTELYSGEITLNRIFSVRSDIDSPLNEETPRKLKQMSKRLTTCTVINEQSLHNQPNPHIHTKIDTNKKTESFNASKQISLPKDVDWSPEDIFELVVESLPIDSGKGLTEWASDYEIDDVEHQDWDKLRIVHGANNELDRKEEDRNAPSYLGSSPTQSRTSSCEANMNDSCHEIESSFSASNYEMCSDHSSSFDYMSSSECSCAENDNSAKKCDADFHHIISETMNMTENLKSFHENGLQKGVGKLQGVPSSQDVVSVTRQLQDENQMRINCSPKTLWYCKQQVKDGHDLDKAAIDEDIVVRSEEITMQDCTVVIMWPKKSSLKSHDRNSPFRSVHLHNKININDLHNVTVEGQIGNRDKWLLSDQKQDNQNILNRIQQEMALVKLQVANETPLVYRTQADSGLHSIRKSEISDQSACMSSKGDVITINRSNIFKHILTTFDASYQKTEMPGETPEAGCLTDVERSAMVAVNDDFEIMKSESDVLEETVDSILRDIVTTIVDFEDLCNVKGKSQYDGTIDNFSNYNIREESCASNKPMQVSTEGSYAPFNSSRKCAIQSNKYGECMKPPEHHIFNKKDQSISLGNEECKGIKNPQHTNDELVQSDISAEETRVTGDDEITLLTQKIKEKIQCLLGSELEIEEEYLCSEKIYDHDKAATTTSVHNYTSYPVSKATIASELEAADSAAIGWTNILPTVITPFDEIRVDATLKSNQEFDPFLSPVYVPGVKDHSAFIENQMQSSTNDMFSQEYETDISQIDEEVWGDRKEPVSILDTCRLYNN